MLQVIVGGMSPSLVTYQINDDLVIAAFIMRIYALYRRDVRVIVFLVITSSTLLAVGCVSVLF